MGEKQLFEERIAKNVPKLRNKKQQQNSSHRLKKCYKSERG